MRAVAGAERGGFLGFRLGEFDFSDMCGSGKNESRECCAEKIGASHAGIRGRVHEIRIRAFLASCRSIFLPMQCSPLLVLAIPVSVPPIPHMAAFVDYITAHTPLNSAPKPNLWASRSTATEIEFEIRSRTSVEDGYLINPWPWLE